MRRTASLALAFVLLALPATGQDDPRVAELILRLQTLEDELRDLRGQIETQRFRQRELEAQVERLLAAPAPASPAAPGTAGDPALGATGTLGGTPPGSATALDTPAVRGGDAQVGATAAVPATSFADGMALLQAGRYPDARAVLDRFVAANPDAENAPEAAFWSAETLFYEGRYETAAAAFAANYRAFGGDAPRAPDSLLKVAMALNQLGDGARACQTLDELQRVHGADLGRSLEAAARRERQRAGCG